jgi:hypothetical protein
MAVQSHGEPLRRYEVTRTVGSRFMQFYIGVQRQGPEPAGHAVYREHMLPFAWWVSLGRWLPKAYFDADGSEELHDGVPVVEAIDRISDVRPYTAVCMNCHNTFAYAYRLFDPMYTGFPDARVAAVVGPLSERLSRTSPVEATATSFQRLNGALDPDRHLVTLGISCESCHFGCREHANENGAVHFLPTSPFIRLTPKDTSPPLVDSRKSAATVNGICAECHSGNVRFFPDCAAQGNSREALDFAKGACANQLRCVSCHEPHTPGPLEAGPDRPEHVALCATCHDSFRDPAKALAHGGHAARAGVTCLDCHMPRYTLGLDEAVRTHRISMPVEQAMVDKSSLNACNLCHLDRSVRWTVTELQRGWGQRFELPKGGAAGNAVDQAMGDVWLKDDDAAVRLIAGQSYARAAAGKQKLPELLRSLNDPEPINRVFALKAVERVAQRKLDVQRYQLTAPPAERARQIEELLTEMCPRASNQPLNK